MKALLCTRYGTPDDLEIADLPDPTPAPGEAVVRIAAAALNFFDTLIIAGKYQTKPPMPFSPSAEFAGTVESVGDGVTAVKAGDRVLAYTRFGAARQRIALAADKLIKIRDSLDFDRAAGLCVTYGTTLHALQDRAKLKRGETLAVLGASGGVGLAAIELGKLMGARVIACASSAEKLDFARRRDLRSGRRRLCRIGVAFDRLAGTVSRRRFCRRRNSQAAAQFGVAQGLRRARRILGLMDRTQSARPSCQYRTTRCLVRRRQIVVARPCGLSA
jgi:D-arabinose 1-dehydrogenase-like Zn-dependent alcohol dehydrogenase